jgi:hypothetical protein
VDVNALRHELRELDMRYQKAIQEVDAILSELDENI